MNTIITKIDSAMGAVEKSIAEHKAGKSAPLSTTLFVRVHGELEKMRTHLSPTGFLPTYPRFVMDWPDDTGLVKQLINVSYEYNKIRR